MSCDSLDRQSGRAQAFLDQARQENQGLNRVCTNIEKQWTQQEILLYRMRAHVYQEFSNQHARADVGADQFWNTFLGQMKTLLHDWKDMLYQPDDAEFSKQNLTSVLNALYKNRLNTVQGCVEDLPHIYKSLIQAKTQKMGVVLDRMLNSKDSWPDALYASVLCPKLFKHDGHKAPCFVALMQEKSDCKAFWPKGFDPTPQFVLEGDSESLLASERGLALKLVLLAAFCVLGQEKQFWALKNAADLSENGGQLSRHKICVHPFVHSMPLPNEIKPCASFQKTPFVFFQNNRPCLRVVHNGYAFGGQRFERQDQFGNGQFPQDCSSLVCLYLGLSAAGSTRDLGIFFQNQTGRIFLEEKNGADLSLEKIQDLKKRWKRQQPKMWLGNILGSLESWSQKILAVPLWEDVQIGDVWVRRTYPDLSLESSLKEKGSGHTGIVVSKDERQKKVLVLSADRCIEGATIVVADNQYVQGLDSGGFLQWCSGEASDQKPFQTTQIFYLRPRRP